MNNVKYSSKEVADYYDQFTETYLNTTGDFIQAFRPTDTDLLMNYITRQLKLEPGMRILDAGCGVGAASIWIAKHFKGVEICCITNSALQYKIASEKIQNNQLQETITATLGDYHRLTDHYRPDHFDRVMFLESLGHCNNLTDVINGVHQMLSPEGFLYIKDFFVRLSKNPEQQKQITDVIKVIDDNYCYNTMHLSDLINVINMEGLSIDSIKKPAIQSDLNITVTFENKTQRLTYPHFIKTIAADWYEILATRL